MKTWGLLRRLWEDGVGAVGIGVLIVFISMILVAAVAAVVLIRTSGFVEQRSYDVGTSSLVEASTMIKLSSVTALTDGTNITELILTILPSGGSNPIDLQKTRMSYRDSSNYVTGIQFGTGGGIAKNFTLVSLQGDGDAVLEVTENDIMELHYQLGDGTSRLEIQENMVFQISLVPVRGVPTELTLSAPPSLDQTYLIVYP